MVCLDVGARLAEFAPAGHEPVDEFRRAFPPDSREVVLEDYHRGPAGQGNPTPSGNQRPLPAAAFDLDLQTSARTCGCLPGGAVAVPDLVDADLVLVPQRLGQRPLHHPPQQAETVPVVGQLVVLGDTPELCLVARHDPEIRVMGACQDGSRFTASHVGSAFGSHDVHRHFQPDLPVDGAVTVPIVLCVVVVDHDVVAEEAGRFGPAMRDQGLVLGKFQLQAVAQEPSDLALDVLGLPSGAGVAQQPIVRIADVVQPPVSPVVDGQECRLDIPVQPVQVDVGEQRAQNSALWRTTQRLVVAPILQISGLKQSVDQAQEPAVVDLLGQDRSHDRMVQRPETVGDVAFDEPYRPAPLALDLVQGGVTSAAWAEAVGEVGELRLVIRFQKGADHFLQQLVRPCRQPQRALLRRVLLVDVGAPDRSPPIALVSQRLNDRLNLPQAHAVHRLRVDAACHGTVVAVDLPVSTQIQFRVEQVPIESLQWQSSLAAFVDDLQQGFGSLHYAYPTSSG